jgi:hypothetical protein
LQVDDLNVLVEHVQAAMAAERIRFAAQNRFLSQLPPMKREVVTHAGLASNLCGLRALRLLLA